MDRTRNSLRNIVFGLTGQILNILMSFAMRTVLINTLGDMYLGVSGLFTNILMVFSLADLGVGTAIIYALYKPIAEGDTKKIQALMKMYAKAYRTIGFVIIGLGLLMTPFIESFCLVSAGQELPPEIKVIFLLYVLNTASTYFLAYKGTLITAHQKNYIVTNVVYSTSILCYGVQIALLYLTHNYVVVLSVQVGTNMLQNVITMILANRMFPYLKEKSHARLRRREKKKIYHDMGSLVFYRMGQVIINGTDSIVISAMVGVVTSGIYSNYILITTTVKNLLQQIFHAITASVGNLAAVETPERKLAVYNTVYFANFWMFGFCSACIWALVNPFVAVCWGEERTMDMGIVLLTVLNFYTMGMRNVNTTFRDTMGVFRRGRFVPLIAAGVNLGVSVALAPSYGVIGVLIGTAVSYFAVLFWLEPAILFRYGFGKPVGMYFVKYLLYLVVTAGICFVTGAVCDWLFPSVSIWTLIGRFAVCAVLPNLLIMAVFWRTAQCRQMVNMVSRVVLRKIGRGKKAPAAPHTEKVDAAPATATGTRQMHGAHARQSDSRRTRRAAPHRRTRR